MSKTKEFLINFRERFAGSEIDDLRQQLEAEEMEWYLYSERPTVNDDDYDSSITEQEF